MHVILQEIRAGISTVSIKNSKIAAFWPSTLVVWLGDVHYYGHSVLIVIFDHAMEGIDCIPLDYSITFLYEFDRFDFGHS